MVNPSNAPVPVIAHPPNHPSFNHALPLTTFVEVHASVMDNAPPNLGKESNLCGLLILPNTPKTEVIRRMNAYSTEWFVRLPLPPKSRKTKAEIIQTLRAWVWFHKRNDTDVWRGLFGRLLLRIDHFHFVSFYLHQPPIACREARYGPRSSTTATTSKTLTKVAWTLALTNDDRHCTDVELSTNLRAQSAT